MLASLRAESTVIVKQSPKNTRNIDSRRSLLFADIVRGRTSPAAACALGEAWASAEVGMVWMVFMQATRVVMVELAKARSRTYVD